ncbi:hypothetical protein [Streptomyces nigrescens]|uniref:Rad50/SbcC-type AAA domain-containing protein n=1 Tax=Streptomyces nigrescens TaxID=1920 RepID=A0A640TZM4_STRNI|nr:hypothetical protein [Streptomyces libani]WAT94406.1 hypothetical protein STRLI_000003 [Streptomyces libani subsp. libani]WAU01565.1 hypothetical protein STRLI_007941 [Streptomyces libani subsp. libani]GFE27535.1 hypothetical protein Sliba_79880 [Streptomyces libani subsp. libani]GGW08439.1 hypothetical protein GCM10010500_79310 [Streptomyces libani subsp. libani]
MGPSFVIERLEFKRNGIWYVRWLKGLVTFLVGHSKSGKSTAIETLLYPLGLKTTRVMPEARSCEQIRLVFRVAGTRWQATRSGADPKARVLLKNLDRPEELEKALPVSSSKAGETTAGAFVQNLLGLPAAVRGTTRLTLDSFYNTVMALRQKTIASEFLGGVPDASRVLAMEVILGLWNESLAGLEKNASEAETQHRAARTALAQFKKLRDSGALTDPDATRAEYEQKVREHKAASEQWQNAAGVLTEAVGELGRLAALYKAAEQHRRKVSRQADAARARLSSAKADLARAEGARDALLPPLQRECTECEQRLPERAPGHCSQCDQPHPEGENRRARQLAAATVKVDRLQLKVRELELAVAAATEMTEAGETAAAQTLTDRDAFEKQPLGPARSAAQQAEKEVFGLSRDVAQLKRQTENADYIQAQEKVIKEARERMEAAQAARDAAQTADEVRRKEVTSRLSEFFLARLRQINPAVETAHIDPHDFTTLVKERNEANKTFDDSSVAGSPKVATNVALLLALRDLGRVNAAVRVPPLLIIDSPLAGLGATGLDHDTSLRLIDTLISISNDPSADGYACQVVAATNDPLPRPYPGVREIPINETDRFFDHAPALES